MKSIIAMGYDWTRGRGVPAGCALPGALAQVRAQTQAEAQTQIQTQPQSQPQTRALRLALALLLAWVWAGVEPSAAQSGDGDAIAIVNGQTITRGELVDLLIDAHGLGALQQLIALKLAQQEARRVGLSVSPEEIQAEFDHALERIVPATNTQGQRLTDAQKREALQAVLEQRGLSQAEFGVGMERNAYLRKLVLRDYEVNEDALRDEFARSFGERVEVRHIQTSDAATLQRALDRLAGGMDFAEVARLVSQNPETAPRGGLMSPFSFHDDAIPPVLREAAFALREGEVSGPVRVEQRYHLLRLERRIPPENARFEEVRAQVEQRLLDRIMPRKMNDVLMQLFRTARTNVLHARLRPRYEELLRRSAAEDGLMP